jgi:hypothetical protein
MLHIFFFLQNIHYLLHSFSVMSAAVNSSSVLPMGDVAATSGTAICSVVQSMGDGTAASGAAAVSISTSGISSDPPSSLFVAIKIVPRSKKDWYARVTISILLYVSAGLAT